MDNKLNSGAIFKNKHKSEGDNKPDYKGTIDVDGKPKEIALWLRTANSGIKYFSVKISEPYQVAPPDQAPAAPQQEAEREATPQQDITDDLPF